MTEQEQWRAVVDRPGYEVSSLGRVRNRRTGRILRQWVAAKRYWYTALGKGYRRAVHVLMAEAFLGPKPSPAHEVAHGDGHSLENNVFGNIRWATHTENVHDQKRHGTLHTPCYQGESHPRAKLSRLIVAELRAATIRRGSLTRLARRYGVDRSTIASAIRGESWAA